MYSRRDFAKMALAGVPVKAVLAQTNKINSQIAGVQIGTQTYSFRDLPLDRAIAATVEVGLGEVELFPPAHVEPRPSAPSAGQNQADTRKAAREALRQWRLTVSLDELKKVRKKFNDAGIEIYAYNYSFVDDFTDDEIDRGFQMTQALGANIITASSTLSAARRVVPFAEKYKMTVAYHGHSDIRDPNQFARPESFAAAMAMSKQFAVNLYPAESLTSPLPIDELDRLGVPVSASTPTVTQATRARTLLQSIELESRQKLWRWFIAATLGVLLIETGMAGWIARRGRKVEATA